MQVRLLGSVELLAAGHAQPVGPPQRRLLLAALAVDAGRPVSPETLVDRVWGSEPPATVLSAVYVHVNRLRRVLDQAAVATGGEATGSEATGSGATGSGATGGGVAGGGVAGRLPRRDGGYLLGIEPRQVDLHEFRRLAAAARGVDCADADRARMLESALDLWRGPALAGLGGSWAARMRDSWARERLDAAVGWAQAVLRLGRHSELIGPVRGLLADHPLAEPLVEVLMQALVAAGRNAEALDCFSTARAHLVDELGVEPGPDLRRLYERLLRADRTPAQRDPSGPAGRVGLPPAQLPPDVPTFSSRQAQLSELDGSLADGAVGQPPTLWAISGTAGVGKPNPGK